MKKLKSAFGIIVGVFSVIGMVSAFNVYTWSEEEELEKDLTRIGADIFQLNRDASQLLHVMNNLQENIGTKKEVFKHKRCILAQIKLSDGREISEETKQICKTSESGK